MIDVVTAIAATVVAVAATDIVAVVRTCNFYCGLVVWRQIVAFAFAITGVNRKLGS